VRSKGTTSLGAHNAQRPADNGFQEPYEWDEVEFIVDKALIEARLVPKIGRRPRRSKGNKCFTGPLRRSARLQVSNGSSDGLCSPGDDADIQVESQLGFDDRPSALSLASTQDSNCGSEEQNHDQRQKFFYLNYLFTMQFDGLMAKYFLECPDLGLSTEGSIKLPGNYDFGSDQ
jgi:hypothetical protein